MSDDDPGRLVDGDDDPLLRDLVDAGKGELPSDKQLASVLAKLGAVTGGGGGGGNTRPGRFGARAAESGGWVGTAKIVVGIAAVVGASWWADSAMRASNHRAASEARARAAASVALPTTNDAVPAPIPAATTDDAMASPLPAASFAKPSPSGALSARPVPVLPPASDSEEELKLLERAQEALVERPSEALTLADEDVRRFPSGLLREEAEVIAIAALVRTGKASDAAARAKRFREAYPTSSHLRRIDDLVRGGAAEAPRDAGR